MELTYDKNNDNKLSLNPPPSPNFPSAQPSHPFDRFCYGYHPLPYFVFGCYAYEPVSIIGSHGYTVSPLRWLFYEHPPP